MGGGIAKAVQKARRVQGEPGDRGGFGPQGAFADPTVVEGYNLKALRQVGEKGEAPVVHGSTEAHYQKERLALSRHGVGQCDVVDVDGPEAGAHQLITRSIRSSLEIPIR